MPHLDGGYTVFGRIVEGLEVIDKIASVKTGQADKPIEDIPMTFKVDKIKKEEITKRYGYTYPCLLYTSPSPRDGLLSRMPSSA